MSFVKSLKCRECGTEYPPIKIALCKKCFGPLDVVYDYDKIHISKTSFDNRPRTIWRYSELLPISDKKNIVDLNTGFTPLIKCVNLGKSLGIRNLYVKNDSVNPTFSFKDRPAEVAVSKAIEFGDSAVACVSTGNLAAAVAAHAGKANLPCYVFTPSSIESSKIAQIASYGAKIIPVRGTYDDANRLAYLASELYGWNIVNITSRPYYCEGSKTLAFEICEQLDWNRPDHVIIPVASGALLCAISRGFQQLEKVGLTKGEKIRLHGAQAEGCAPIAKAFTIGADKVLPVEHPKTIAKSIAIGDPGDGLYVLREVRRSEGVVGAVSDLEIVESIKLLAKTEGIFTEPAGSVTIALAKRLIEEGRIRRDDIVVCCVTGNGLKTIDAVSEYTFAFSEIEPTLEALSSSLG